MIHFTPFSSPSDRGPNLRTTGTPEGRRPTLPSELRAGTRLPSSRPAFSFQTTLTSAALSWRPRSQA